MNGSFRGCDAVSHSLCRALGMCGFIMLGDIAMRNLIAIVLVAGLAACGGGGGGEEGSGRYGGTWRFQGTKMSDNCRSNLAQNVAVDLKVSQDGDSVTIQSGSLVATGSVNDRDGVSATLTRPGDSGCTQAVSIVFSNASDGQADVGYALGAQCGGVTCAVGYAGTAVRTGKVDVEGVQVDDPDSMVEAISELAAGSEEGVEGGILSALEEAQLAIEATQP